VPRTGNREDKKTKLEHYSHKFGGVQQRNREKASKQQRKQELTARQAVLKLTGVSHYVVKFECDKCIRVIPRKFLLDPLVGDECRVEWSGEEYAAKILAVGDDQ
jgi:hypothetical protein